MTHPCESDEMHRLESYNPVGSTRNARVFYGSFTLHEDGSITWHPNLYLSLTPDEQCQHNWPIA